MIRALLLATSLLFSYQLRAETEQASVRVEVYTTANNTLPDAIIQLIERGTRKAIDVQFQDFVAHHVPYGEYTLSVWRPGFKHFQQPLKVYQPEVSLRVCLSISNAEDAGEPLKLRGMIHSTSLRDLWIKIVPILNTDSPMDTAVQSDGRFQLTGMVPGKYLLVVIRKQQVVFTEQVAVPDTAPVEITLP